MITHPIAKINLGLNIVNRRPDGYHDLETVFYPVPISDKLEVTSAAPTVASDCTLTLGGIPVEGDTEHNLVVRAYRILQHDIPTLPPITIRLEKNIPTQAGMGGGSSDATFMLRMLNDMFSLGLDTDRLCDYALRLGADCPFFVEARPAYAEGIGERLTPIPLNLSGWYLAVVRPDIPVSTREAFSLVRPCRPPRCCRDIVSQPVETWREVLTNDFEQSVFNLHPELGAVKQQLYDMGAAYATMSGSGSSLIGLFHEPVDLTNAFRAPGTFTRCVQLG